MLHNKNNQQSIPSAHLSDLTKHEDEFIEMADTTKQDPEAVASVEARHTPEEEKAFVRKLDRRVLPWIMLLYLLSYLDRSNLGNSVALGIKKDLNLVGTDYEWASAMFYVATFCFGTVGGLMLKIVKPSYYLGGCCIGWGMMAALQATAKGFGSLAGIRFLLGLFEASFAPGCAFYLSFWYTKHELVLRIAAYAGTSALSGVIGGLISYGFGTASNHPLKRWQWLFISEGIPTIVIGLITPFVLADRPEVEKPKWLSEAELAIAMDRRTRYVKNASDPGVNWKQVGMTFLDYRLWLFAVLYSGLSLSLAVIAIFLPSLLGVMGYASYKANLMTVPPYAVGYFGLLLISWLSDRYRQRGFPIAIASTIGGAGYLIVGLVKESKVRYFGAFMAVAGTYWSFPLVLGWISNTFATDSKSATGLGVVIAVTHAVGIAAAHIYPTKDSPQYRTGSIVSAALMFASCASALFMRSLLDRENKKRDAKYGIAEADGAVLGSEGDKDANMRYIL
ncbi:hypothetical protein V866_000674 [Kwoniella sp. B9012]